MYSLYTKNKKSVKLNITKGNGGVTVMREGLEEQDHTGIEVHDIQSYKQVYKIVCYVTKLFGALYLVFLILLLSKALTELLSSSQQFQWFNLLIGVLISSILYLQVLTTTQQFRQSYLYVIVLYHQGTLLTSSITSNYPQDYRIYRVLGSKETKLLVERGGEEYYYSYGETWWDIRLTVTTGTTTYTQQLGIGGEVSISEYMG